MRFFFLGEDVQMTARLLLTSTERAFIRLPASCVISDQVSEWVKAMRSEGGFESSLECKTVIRCLCFHEYAQDIIYGKLRDSRSGSN